MRWLVVACSLAACHAAPEAAKPSESTADCRRPERQTDPQIAPVIAQAQDPVIIYCRNMARTDRCCADAGADWWEWTCDNSIYVDWIAAHCAAR